MMLRKFFILYGITITSFIVVIVLSFVFWDKPIANDLAGTLVTVIFSLFGFSLTSFSIILSITNRSEKILTVFNKGYNVGIIIALLCLLVYSTVSILFLIFDFHKGVLVSLFIGSIFLIAYYIYFIAALILNRKE